MSDAARDRRAAALQHYLQILVDKPAVSPELLRFLLGDGFESLGTFRAMAQATPRLEPSLPLGLMRTLRDSCVHFPMRIMIVDNSGSMGTSDGHRLVTTGGRSRLVGATRWQELSDDIKALASLALLMNTRLDLHLLNPSRGFSSVSVGHSAAAEGISALGPPAGMDEIDLMVKGGPTGTTPLTEAVQKVIEQVRPSADKLRAKGQQVAVVISTDGLPNDGVSFVRALKELQKLPVWVVVRLCTDDDRVVDYWNELDGELEAPLEVLDDVRGEAQEVYKHNPWLTYMPILHYARMMGLPDKVFDALDEAPLLPSQCRELIEAIVGGEALPEPEDDLQAFRAALSSVQAVTPLGYDARRGCSGAKWVDEAVLEQHVKRAMVASGQMGGGMCAVM